MPTTRFRPPGLRFDKVARSLIEHVKKSIRGAVPRGTVVVFTVAAPIRQDSKTRAKIGETILVLLRRPATRVENAITFLTNRIRIRIVKTGSRSTPKVVGFIHNPATSAEGLLDRVISSTLGFKSRDRS